MKKKSKLKEHFALKVFGDEDSLLDQLDPIRKLAQWLYLFDFAKTRSLPTWVEYQERYGFREIEDAARWSYRNPKLAKRFLEGMVEDVALHVSLAEFFSKKSQANFNEFGG